MTLPVALIDTSQRPAWVGLASPAPPGPAADRAVGILYGEGPRSARAPDRLASLSRGEKDLLLVRELGEGRRAGDELVGELIELAHTAGLEFAGIAALLVVRGPGSFTGVRSGIAAAQGLARATGVPLVGIDSLTLATLAAAPAPGEHVAAFAAGRGGRVYGALFAGLDGGRVRVVEAVAERTYGEWQVLCPTLTRCVRAGAAIPAIASLALPSHAARLEAAVRFAAGAAATAPEGLLPLYARDWR